MYYNKLLSKNNKHKINLTSTLLLYSNNNFKKPFHQEVYYITTTSYKSVKLYPYLFMHHKISSMEKKEKKT